MGKHERSWAQPAEIDVANGLNGNIKNQHIHHIVDSIKQEIGSDYSHAKWVGGNDYNNPGDVHVYWDNKIEKIELKFSRKGGKGTIKNPTQGIFTKMISNTIQGYRQWDIDLGLKDQRWKLVESVTNKPLKNQTDYSTRLRELKPNNPALIQKIADITSPGQISYATYAAEELDNYIPEVNNMVTKILGISNLSLSTDKNLKYCLVKFFETDKQTVEFVNFTAADNIITKVESSGKSIKFLNADGMSVLSFSVSWRNICQGGANPAFAVFTGNAHK